MKPKVGKKYVTRCGNYVYKIFKINAVDSDGYRCLQTELVSVKDPCDKHRLYVRTTHWYNENEPDVLYYLRDHFGPNNSDLVRRHRKGELIVCGSEVSDSAEATKKTRINLSKIGDRLYTLQLDDERLVGLLNICQNYADRCHAGQLGIQGEVLKLAAQRVPELKQLAGAWVG